jgi:hypothetical protein
VRFLRATRRLLGFAAPKHEAKEITSRIRACQRDEFTPERSETKTRITHDTSQAARFLGSEVSAQHADDTRGRRGSVPSMTRSACSCPSR